MAETIEAVIELISPVIKAGLVTASRHSDRLVQHGWMGEDAVAFDFTKTAQAQRSGPRSRPSQVAQPLLLRISGSSVWSEPGGIDGSPERSKVLTGEPYAGDPRVRFRREGRRKPMRRPYLYLNSAKNGTLHRVHVRAILMTAEFTSRGDIGQPGGSNILEAYRGWLRGKQIESSPVDQHSHYGMCVDVTIDDGTVWEMIQFPDPWLMILKPNSLAIPLFNASKVEARLERATALFIEFLECSPKRSLVASYQRIRQPSNQKR
ncbi:MAG: hypothetical protein R3F19_00325 [Verrucomicrobiales bacterium]